MPKTTSGFAAKPLKGENHPKWKGGKVLRMGYEAVRMPEHPRAHDSYVFVHVLVAEKKYGRPLKKGENVHHIDGNKRNNDPENIKIIKAAEHGSTHHAPIFPELRDKEWLEEKSKTMGSRKIAKIIGCNPRTVYDFQKLHGIKSSLKGGRPKNR